MDDHDLLQRIDERVGVIDKKMTSLCSDMKKTSEQNDTDHETIRAETTACRLEVEKGFVRKGTFWKVLGLVNFTAISAFLYKVFA